MGRGCAGLVSEPEELCVDHCREAHITTAYCRVLEVTGVDSSWSYDVRDINNKYRLEEEGSVAIMRNGRPQYRSVPARRIEGSDDRVNKLNYVRRRRARPRAATPSLTHSTPPTARSSCTRPSSTASPSG